MSDTLKTWPERIYLVHGVDAEVPNHYDCANGEVTWCEDKQFDSDIEYVRADRIEALEREKAELVAALTNLATVYDAMGAPRGPARIIADSYIAPASAGAGGEEGLKEIPLNIIRYWPEGMPARLEHVWRDLIGFIPNYKLYDLQRMLAEYGFTMKIYQSAAPGAADRKGE